MKRQENFLFSKKNRQDIQAAGIVIFRLRENEREFLLVNSGNTRKPNWTPPKGHRDFKANHTLESEKEAALR